MSKLVFDVYCFDDVAIGRLFECPGGLPNRLARVASAKVEQYIFSGNFFN